MFIFKLTFIELLNKKYLDKQQTIICDLRSTINEHLNYIRTVIISKT